MGRSRPFDAATLLGGRIFAARSIRCGWPRVLNWHNCDSERELFATEMTNRASRENWARFVDNRSCDVGGVAGSEGAN